MTGLLFLAALAALPLIGYPFQRFPVFAPLHPAARWGLAGALGALVICVEMVLASAMGLRWSVWLLLVPSAVVALLRRGANPGAAPAPSSRPPALAAGAAGLILAVIAYAAATARATAADFVLFWGAKSERFGMARSIDVAYLRDPLHYLMHPDYPPMVTCLYAWASLVAGRFAWGAALLGLPLFLALTVVTFFGFAQPALGRRVAAEYACMLAALLGVLMTADMVAGDAEPVLLYFEVLTLSALLFAGLSPGGLAAAAIGLAGAVLTKIEGTVFAGLAVILYVALLAAGRRRRTAAVLAVAPAAVLAGWLVFCWRNGLLDIYRLGGRGRLALGHLPIVLREIVRNGSSGLRFAPWIVVAVLFVGRRPTRESVSVLLMAAGFAAFLVYMYLTTPADPTLWIQWSAARLLIWPLLYGFFAAAAAGGQDRRARSS